MGSDLRGVTSADACFNFALSGVNHMDSLFQSLCNVGIHELKRSGARASFQSKQILHMVEKFAASDIQGSHALELYHIAGICLETKGHSDVLLIEEMKSGKFGFSSKRPLIWLWRFSSKRRKEVPNSHFATKKLPMNNWGKIFDDPSKPLVVDLGSGMGASLLNLANVNATMEKPADTFNDDGTLNMPWSDCNYVGAELNQAMVNFGDGVISRDKTSRRKGRVNFFCFPAEVLLHHLEKYPGRIAFIMINFPTPYRLEDRNSGNSMLPLMNSGCFMVTNHVLQSISFLLSRLDRSGLFLFQTKSEDVAVHVKNECLALGSFECVPCRCPVNDIQQQYTENGKMPKRVNDWLDANPSAERAEGHMYSSVPLLPEVGWPETEVQCKHDNLVVHRCLFRTN